VETTTRFEVLGARAGDDDLGALRPGVVVELSPEPPELYTV